MSLIKSTHKYYRLGGLPLALQIWIFDYCSKVDEDIAIRVADSIPRILNWKTIAESPWQKYIEKCLFMPTKNKFENIVASEDEVSKFRLPEPRDYNAEILKLEPKGSSHGLDMFTNEVIELRKELVKSGGSSSVIREVREPFKKQAGERFSDEDAAGIAIEKVLSEVVADINVGAQPDDATEDCQQPLHTLDDFIFLVEDLSQINRTEESYLKKRAPIDQNKKKVTPKKRGRKKNPGKLITSPYTQHFESGGTLCVTRQFFETKHLFAYATRGDNESDLIDSFTNWLYTGTKKRGKKPYIDALNVISPTFELVGCHWIFVMFDIGQRSLEVYDSFPARNGVNFEVKNIVEMLSIVLPYYLSVVKFYDKRSELKATPKYSGIDEFEKIGFHLITKGVPKQRYDSMDWGVFAAAFAEIVSNGQHILNQHVKANILRKRFGAILWEYARRKQVSDLQSEDEKLDR
ncbi:hypothetical protein KY285_012227 [Solanum tuberosum]|nr:hypothetical protein KY289_012751 [Solanum tuberosum]KAH0736520.1 hypothetical protein KY285_012227 [Solanum tuberosum]